MFGRKKKKDEPAAQQAEAGSAEPEAKPEKKKGWFSRLKDGLTKSKDKITDGIDAVIDAGPDEPAADTTAEAAVETEPTLPDAAPVAALKVDPEPAVSEAAPEPAPAAETSTPQSPKQVPQPAPKPEAETAPEPPKSAPPKLKPEPKTEPKMAELTPAKQVQAKQESAAPSAKPETVKAEPDPKPTVAKDPIAKVPIAKVQVPARTEAAEVAHAASTQSAEVAPVPKAEEPKPVPIRTVAPVSEPETPAAKVAEPQAVETRPIEPELVEPSNREAAVPEPTPVPPAPVTAKVDAPEAEPAPPPEESKAEPAQPKDETAKDEAKPAEKKKPPGLAERIVRFVRRRKLDDDALESIEDVLIMADLGPATAAKLTANLARDKFDKAVSSEEVREALAEDVAGILEPVALPLTLDPDKRPHVVLVVGVNGSGKTTTIGKLGKQWAEDGLTVTFAAGDTFRAAAVEQLKIWGERAGASVIARDTGADAAGLAYDALEGAAERGDDVLLIDTAGRLQNKADLMAELEKIVRVLRKLDESAPHSVLLVLDATVGQNAHSQVQIFKEIAEVSGLIVTKLDGSAKGGVIVALAEAFGLPIHAIGVGEGADDMRPFEPREFARSLMGLDA